MSSTLTGRISMVCGLLGSLAFASIAQAQTTMAIPLKAESDVVATTPDPACAFDRGDALETPVRINKTSQLYAGKCMNTARFRASSLLPSAPAGHLIINNFYHDNQFWIADIPMDPQAWDHGNFQILRFNTVKGVAAAHTEMLFQLKAGHVIQLKSQIDPTKTETVDALLYSVEAAFPVGVPYNFALGVFDNYPINARLLSISQSLAEGKNSGYEQYRLNLKQSDLPTLVRNAALRSQALGVSHFYSTIRPNCTTEAFDLLDSIKPISKRPRAFLTVASADPIAGPAIAALRSRGLLGPRQKNMEELYPPFKKRGGEDTVVVGGVVRTLPNAPIVAVTLVPEDVDAQRVADLLMLSRNQLIADQLSNLSYAMIAGTMTEVQAKAAVSAAVQKAQKSLRAMIARINNQLPSDHAVRILTYLAPYSFASKPADVVINNAPAALPFNQAQEVNVPPMRLEALIETINSGMKTLQNTQYMVKTDVPVFLLGAAISMNLQKDRSEVTVQTSFSLVPQNLPMKSVNNQVSIVRAHLPAPTSQWFVSNDDTLKAGFVTTQTQKWNEMQDAPILFEFGGVKDIDWDLAHDGSGLLRIEQDDAYCLDIVAPGNILGAGLRSTLVPKLEGTIVNAGIGKTIDGYLKGDAIAFDIYSFNLVDGPAAVKNKSGVAIDDMSARVQLFKTEAPIARCLNMQSVSKQLQDQSNVQLDAALTAAAAQGKELLLKNLLGH